MRKWTYLVAALLMSGTAATFTSCIDTTEPAGIETLRGAKAELLQAKAKVELAEAEKRLADAEYKKALAAIKQEKANQEALRTALKAEKNEKKIAKIKQEMELSAAEHRQALAVALAAAEEAEMKYQQTLIDIELALLGHKENAYAQELKKLLSEESFTYTSKQFKFEIGDDGQYVYDKNTGKIEFEIVEKEIEIDGYYDLLQTLSEERRNLADLNRDLINLSLQIDYTDLKKENDAMIAYYQGLIDADTELLAEYKKIGDLDITAWEAEYETLKTNIKTAEEAKTAIDDKLANDLLPYQEKQREIEAKYKEEKEYTFTFDKEISNIVKYTISNVIYRGYDRYFDSDRINYIYNELTKQSVVDEDNNRIFNNGLKLSLNINEFYYILNGFGYYDNLNGQIINVGGLLPVIESYYELWTAQEAANSELELKKLEVNKNDALNAYNDEIAIWKPLHDDFIAKAQAYKYNYKAEAASEKYDRRNEMIKKVAEFNALTTEEKQSDAKIKEYADEFAKYLNERYELDAWQGPYDNTDPDNVVYYKDALADADAAKQKAAFLEFIVIGNDDQMFGPAVLSTTYDEESLYSKLIASAKKIWGENKYEATDNGSGIITLDQTTLFSNDELVVMVEFDMEEWLAQDVEAIKFLEGIYNNANYTTVGGEFGLTILGDGLANDRFASENLYNKFLEPKEKHTSYGNFLAELEKLEEAYDAEIETINQERAENENAMAALESTAEQEKAKYTKEISGYNDVMEIMATVIERNEGVDGTTVSPTEKSIEAALEKIKNAIIDIEGGLKVTSTDNGDVTEYVYGSLVEYNAWIGYYQNINKGLEDGTYTVEGLYDERKEMIETNIEVKEAEIEALEALYNNATKKKDELLKVITGSTANE